MDKIDGRIVRSKQMLREALMELIDEKGFDAISVRDLTTKAGLNRGTFYLHYQDKYDMLQQVKKELIDGLKALIGKVKPDTLFYHSNLDEPVPILIDVCHYFYGHAFEFRILAGPKGDPSFMAEIKGFMEGHIYNKLIDFQPREDKMMVPRELIIPYISSAHLGIILYWLNHGTPYSPEHMALLITRIARLGPMNTLGI